MGRTLFTVTAADRAGNVQTVPFTVTRDITPPEVAIHVPASSDLVIPVTWSGQDTLSSLRDYTVRYSHSLTGPWTTWLTGTTTTSGQFPGAAGQTYYFQVEAVDNVNNNTTAEAGPVTISAVTKYYYHADTRVAMRQGDVVHFLHGDHLGSTSLTTNQAGGVVAQSRYLPYGQTHWLTGTLTTDFQYTSQRQEGFGLYDYNARYYVTGLGRFISPDTIVPDPTNPQNLNRYSYVLESPVKYRDPSGHDVDCGIGESGCRERVAAEKLDSRVIDSNGDGKSSIFDIEKIDYPAGGKIQFGMPKRAPVSQTAADTFGSIAMAIDSNALILSALGTAGALIAATVTAESGALPGYETVNVIYQGNVGFEENILAGASLLATAASDVAAGNTYLSDEGLIVGQDTYVAATFAAAGLIPDVTTDSAINLLSVGYDGESLKGHPGVTRMLPGNMFISKYWVVPFVPPRP